MPRLSPYRGVDDPGRSGDAPVLRVRALARLAGDHLRALPHHRFPGVRRPLRGAGLEASERDRPDHLHRLVALAHRLRCSTPGIGSGEMLLQLAPPALDRRALTELFLLEQLADLD